MSPEQISARLGVELYKIRNSLREMVSAGLVREETGGYVATEREKKKL